MLVILFILAYLVISILILGIQKFQYLLYLVFFR